MSEYEEFIFRDAPDPYEPPQRPNLLRPIIAVFLVIVLIGGSAYAALRPFFAPDDFAAVLTGVSEAGGDCRNAPRVNPTGVLKPTNRICVCGRIIPHEEGEIDYYLRVYDGNREDLLYREKISTPGGGAFCNRLSLDETLSGGRYLIEISNGRSAPEIAILRFSVRQANRQA
ncbi:MAG: hypothetical protein L0154_02995 [Chloroflexi bacterium]|nr:hypothetical protein [Chloroflexota bacterium]